MTLFHESKTKGKGKGKAPERHASTSTSTNTTSPYPSTSGTSGGTQSPISAPPTSIQESENVGAEDIPAHLRDEDLPAYNTDGGVEGGEASTSRRRRFNLFPDPNFASLSATGPGLESRAALDRDGKIDVFLKFKNQVTDLPSDYASAVEEYAIDHDSSRTCPPLNIVIFIVGSRGDVQPYIALALGLIRSHSHRVRIATHGEFMDLVLEANRFLKGQKGYDDVSLEGRLEFFDVGGDPKELMAYMVKNPGLLPGFASLKNGDVKSKRRMTTVLLKGFYHSTFFPDSRNGYFAADAIISNPPAFAHIHVAEALGIPLHMSFTMPWSPTTEFHHPLVNIKESNADRGLTNYLSYSMADLLMWHGLGDLINKFRHELLGLQPLFMRSGPSVLDRLRVPWTYCWSEDLIPMPKDWKQHIDISGFYFMDGETRYQPDTELSSFLSSGPPPIYIGFGSVPVQDPKAMTETIFSAVQMAGVRALVSAGWGGLGDTTPPDNVFILKGNIPHDWLFAEGRVAAVCHHGGAGTTAIGLRNGLPTIVVPFFGDQPFWGEMIRNAGAGPSPIPPKHLNPDTLVQAIEFAFSPSAQTAAKQMGEKIQGEDGVQKGVDSFHRHLPLLNMRCDLDPTRVALWWSKDLYLKLSGAAAAVLVSADKLNFKSLEPYRSKEYETTRNFSTPWTQGASGLTHVLTTSASGIAQMAYAPARGATTTMLGVPLAGLAVVQDVYQKIDNIPQHIGSDTRERRRVKGIKSGFREGGLGFLYGLWDGVMGLVTEPYVGAQREGTRGAVKGVGRSIVNLGARPAAGALGLFTLPTQGMYRSAEHKIRRTRCERARILQSPREQASLAAAQPLTHEQRAAIIDAFSNSIRDTKKRKGEARARRTRWLLRGEMINPSQEASDSYRLARTMSDPTCLTTASPMSPDTGSGTFTSVDTNTIPSNTTWTSPTSPSSTTMVISPTDIDPSHPPPEYGFRDTKVNYVSQLARHNTEMESHKDRYLGEMDRTETMRQDTKDRYLHELDDAGVTSPTAEFGRAPSMTGTAEEGDPSNGSRTGGVEQEHGS